MPQFLGPLKWEPHSYSLAGWFYPFGWVVCLPCCYCLRGARGIAHTILYSDSSLEVLLGGASEPSNTSKAAPPFDKEELSLPPGSVMGIRNNESRLRLPLVSEASVPAWVFLLTWSISILEFAEMAD